MKNVLITGGCGFIGSNFVKSLLATDTGYYPIILDSLTYAGNKNNLDNLHNDSYAFIEGDICDKTLVTSLFEKYHFQGVFHFAAESHVDRSIDGPQTFINTNIIGTYNLLDVARLYYNNDPSFKFIHVSTDEVYGDLGDGGYFTENTPYNPNSPYSASKASSDHLARAWHRTYGLPVVITNCSNNYGAFQFPEKLIPLMIINCLDSKPLPVYGDGNNIRDWLFVDDHCSAIKVVYENGTIGETYNIGGNNEIKNIDIVITICTILDDLHPSDNGKSYSELITFVKDRPGHDFRYAINAKKIQNELGWFPHESFETGIKKTVEWYLENKSWWKKIQDERYNQERLGRGI